MEKNKRIIEQKSKQIKENEQELAEIEHKLKQTELKSEQKEVLPPQNICPGEDVSSKIKSGEIKSIQTRVPRESEILRIQFAPQNDFSMKTSSVENSQAESEIVAAMEKRTLKGGRRLKAYEVKQSQQDEPTEKLPRKSQGNHP